MRFSRPESRSRAPWRSARSTSSSMCLITSLSTPSTSEREELVAVPIGVERLVKGDLRLGLVVAPQVHEDLVFDAAGRVGGQLDLLRRVEGVDRLDQADGADGDQIFDMTPVFSNFLAI